MSMD